MITSALQRVTVRVLLILAFGLLYAPKASALPIFARRYETSCTTCHAIIPKLNPFGIAFRNNGYRIPVSDAQLIKTPDVSLGAPAWKTIWPKAVWPGAIPGVPPVAFRVNAAAVIEPSQPVQLNFDFPEFLALYFAGSAGDTVSYFGQVIVAGSPASIDINRAYAQFRLMPERPGDNWLMLRVGRLDNRAEPFSSTFRRTTLQAFNVSDYRVLDEGFGLDDRNPGLEAWGAVTGPHDSGGAEYAVGVIQGISQSDISEYGGPSQPSTVAAALNSKDYYWNASYKLGGYGVVGSRKERESVGISNNYGEKSVSLGTFGYRGKRPTDTAGSDVNTDEFARTGAKADVYYRNLNVFGAVVAGRDDLKGLIPRSIRSSAIFVESDWMALPWGYAVGTPGKNELFRWAAQRLDHDSGNQFRDSSKCPTLRRRKFFQSDGNQ